jgi:hypothetical protein
MSRAVIGDALYLALREVLEIVVGRYGGYSRA